MEHLFHAFSCFSSRCQVECADFYKRDALFLRHSFTDFFHHLNYAKYNLFLFCFLFIENVRVCIVVQFLIFLDLSDSQVALTTRSKTV